MSDNSNIVTPPECVGVIFGAEHAVYADTGFEAIRDETFTPEPYVCDTTPSAPNLVEQIVSVFPSADKAQAVLASSQKRWRSCAQGTVTRKLYEGADAYELGSVQLQGDVLTVSMVAINRESSDSACQQVLRNSQDLWIGLD